MQGVLLDLDGVIYQGATAIAGATATLGWLEAQGIPYRFVTNTTSRPRAELVARLSGLGIHTEPGHILTPPVAANRWLSQHANGTVALFVPASTAREFTANPHWRPGDSDPPAAVVVGDLGNQWDFERLNRAFRALMQAPHPCLLALGMTRYWRADDGLRLDTGPFVAALEYASGCEAVVLGKPATAFYQVAADSLDLPTHECLMVGDDIRGDVGGAQQAGMAAILVRTGKFQDSDLDNNIQPTALLDSIADLPTWWSGAH